MRRRFQPKRYLAAPPKKWRANLQIKAPQVKVIDEDGKMLGVLNTSEAIKMAREKELDLIEVNPQANPPIAKIVDYGKYMYRQDKSKRGQKKKQFQAEIKTVRIGLKTGEHDLQVKAQTADRFLGKGHEVKLEIFLRGRERAFRDLARQKLGTFLNFISVAHEPEEGVKSTPQGFSQMIRSAK